MHVDIAKVLHVLAHELRTPSGIAQGYLRMLLEDRFPDPADRRRAIEQTQKALARVSELTHESTKLANWMEADRQSPTRIDAATLVSRAVELAAIEPQPAVAVDASASGVRIATIDADALSTALASIIKATARELKTKVCSIDARSYDNRMLDVRIGPADELAKLTGGPEAADAAPLTLERGGLGLSLVAASVVLEVHAATGWTANGSRTTVGIRLPLEERAPQ
jgi:signal transduction histidine kinase